MSNTCGWEFNSEHNLWETGCNWEYWGTDMSQQPDEDEDGFRWCPYCGNEIVIDFDGTPEQDDLAIDMARDK